jgi:hypothetical protein
MNTHLEVLSMPVTTPSPLVPVVAVPVKEAF